MRILAILFNSSPFALFAQNINDTTQTTVNKILVSQAVNDCVNKVSHNN